jgi:elongation factor Ts
MTVVTATMVKTLRDRTGAGMMDCKTALTETQGDMEQAVDWLRKKGLSKAAKKAERAATDGLIGVITADKVGAIVEVNSETDFVARNAQFQDLVRTVTSLAPHAGGDLGKLLAASYPDKGVAVEEHIKAMVATIGENMSVRRTAVVTAVEGVVSEYVHNKVADGLGRIGVLVALESKGEKSALASLGRQLAMHIAAASPAAIRAEDLDPALVERERAIYAEQARASGKSAEIAAKMIEGRLRKEFLQQVVLLQQIFLGAGGDGKATVDQVLKSAEKAVGAPVAIGSFVRYALGEGDRSGPDPAEAAAAAKG